MSALGSKLRTGTYADLNLYVVRDMTGNRAGDCSLPTTNIKDGIENDGCRIAARTFTSDLKDAGVAIHEIGHWLGLLHTFQSEVPSKGKAVCGDEFWGDSIEDTPLHLQAEDYDWGDCKDVNLDTCPDDPVSAFFFRVFMSGGDADF